MIDIANMKHIHHSKVNIYDNIFEMYKTMKNNEKDIRLHIFGVGACMPPPNERIGISTIRKISDIMNL